MPAVRAGRLPPAARAAVLLLPAALVGMGLLARALAARAFDLFIRYETPFAFPPAPQPAVPALTPRVVLVLVDGLGVQASRSLPFLNSCGRGAPTSPAASACRRCRCRRGRCS